MVRTSENEIKKNFPNLYKELEESESKTEEPESIESAADCECLTEHEQRQTPPVKNQRIRKLKVDRGRSYEPSALDFLQRCSTNEEALEIISYLEKRGEITGALAESLRKKVATKGVRAFGPKREPGYYHKAFD
ncbi:MAG: DUF2095 domain-containing protein [Candidatus Methanomethylicus sp.]|nr:DUF2095 domain-containing protein [Candidatus Methanomethylicus sp.]